MEKEDVFITFWLGASIKDRSHLIDEIVCFFQTPLAFICSLKEQVVDPDEKPGGNKEQPRMMK